MSFIIFLILFSSFAYSVEQGKKEWRHNRDRHAENIAKNNPDWHPRKVRRHARLRSFTWAAAEACKGFPAMRRAWREDRDHVKYLRETRRISQETRIDELRAELDAIRRGREEHEAARKAGDTRLPFGPWYEKNAPRIREEAPVPAPAAPSADTPPRIEEIQPPPPADGPDLSGQPAPEPADTETAAPSGTKEKEVEDLLASMDDLLGRNGAATPATQPAGSATASMPSGELAGDSPYRAAFTALEQYDQAAAQHRQAAEVLEAQLTMHGFDRDQQLMTHVRGMQESAGQISAEVASARQTLIGNHAQGAEYHQSGVDADSSAFSNHG